MYAFMAFMVAGALVALGFAIRSGAVKDDESPKYRMLQDDEPLESSRNPGGKHE